MSMQKKRYKLFGIVPPGLEGSELINWLHNVRQDEEAHSIMKEDLAEGSSFFAFGENAACVDHDPGFNLNSAMKARPSGSW